MCAVDQRLVAQAALPAFPVAERVAELLLLQVQRQGGLELVGVIKQIGLPLQAQLPGLLVPELPANLRLGAEGGQGRLRFLVFLARRSIFLQQDAQHA